MSIKLNKRKTLRWSAICILIAASCICASAQSGSTPDAVIQDFYKWYIVAVDSGKDPMKGARTTLKKYVTLRFINQIARDEARGVVDVDPFVQTQEWDKEWANNVTVSDLKVKATTATAIMTFGSDTYPRVAVTLVKASGVWKIDRVKDATK